MKKIFVLLIVLLFLLTSCAPSEIDIQTAIAKTQAALPTLTFTPYPTDTPVPTYTPSPTETSIPTSPPPTAIPTTAIPPTAIPPTAPPPTAIPVQPTQSNLVLDITIEVENQCSVQHTVIFDGPQHLKFVVDPGALVAWQAAHGTYSWTVDGVYDGTQDLYTAHWRLTLCY